ncbi:MAG: tRNA (adenosine(37)-N6)-threonylcarbamoyltransferase complex transferase subunit TsaD [Lentisphaeria bacterium]|nr:tRNA (adenosine(37)-N6)-threonylcarbamoyltransferase complex transferase subunit TsaD [Lentisphaeria bacterium]
MRILGIETSCDETAVAIVEDGHQVLSNVISSQMAKHAQFGGVIPELAAREHLIAIDHVVEQALKDANCTLDDINAVAATQTPGLLPALLVGLSYGKGLAASRQLPFIGINHFLAHIYGAFIEQPNQLKPECYPAIALIVSGGHTAIIKINRDGSCELVGQTLDDAAGEAFDKAAKILNLPYPGGPVIDSLAKEGDPKTIQFPRALCGAGGTPLKPENRYNFSFSGVKTSLLYAVKGYENLGNLDMEVNFEDTELCNIAASYQESIVDVLVKKTLWAAKDYNANQIVMCGGVACNSRLRSKMQVAAEEFEVPLVIAPPKYCTDNAAMIAGLAWSYLKNDDVQDWSADAVPRLGLLKRIPFVKNA